jgi:hypothetical protein
MAYLQFLQQQQTSHDLLISNQVSTGVEQLAIALSYGLVASTRWLA